MSIMLFIKALLPERKHSHDKFFAQAASLENDQEIRSTAWLMS
jgi:hypothetical protein